MTYISDYAVGSNKQNNYDFCPGCGFWNLFKSDAYDYFNARGYINFKFLKYFSIQFGHDKNFIGNGVATIWISNNENEFDRAKMKLAFSHVGNYEDILKDNLNNK